MKYEILSDYVMEVNEVNTGAQIATIKTFHDMLYHTKLEHDSTNSKVKATVYNYLDELQTTYADTIIFEYEGSQVTATPIDGVATIDFSTTVSGEHTVKTVNTTIRNGEVIIVV